MKIFTLLITLFAGLSVSAQDTISNANRQIMYQGMVWEVSTPMRNDFGEGFDFGGRLNLILHVDKSTLKDFYWISEEVLKNLQDDAVILVVPYMSCGIAYDLFILAAVTDHHLLFEGFNGFSGETFGTGILMSKK